MRATCVMNMHVRSAKVGADASPILVSLQPMIFELVRQSDSSPLQATVVTSIDFTAVAASKCIALHSTKSGSQLLRVASKLQPPRWWRKR